MDYLSNRESFRRTCVSLGVEIVEERGDYVVYFIDEDGTNRHDAATLVDILALDDIECKVTRFGIWWRVTNWRPRRI